MKPSEIHLSVPPLHGTLGKAELEAAAACIVRACQFHGDEWKPIDAPMIGVALRSDVATLKEPFASLVSNPFWRPDVWLLVERRFARWTDQPGGPCELLPHALALIEAKHGRALS